MGLFSPKKISQPPLPKLEIYLHDSGDKIYRSGDVVAGHVALTPVESIEPQAIQLAFFGRSRIWHRLDTSSSDSPSSYDHWRDNAPLFMITKDVLPAISTTDRGKEDEKLEPALTKLQPDRTYTFPFAFTFPSTTENSRMGQYNDDFDKRFIIGPHDLPPTTTYTSRYSKDSSEPNFAKIEYGVSVELICPSTGGVQGKGLTNLTASSLVRFHPVNRSTPALNLETELAHRSKQFTLKSSILIGQHPHQIGIRQSLRDYFSSSTPRLTFSIDLTLPLNLTLGARFSFRASLTVLSRTENASHLPSIKFTALKLHLLHFTFYRAPRDRNANDTRSGAHRDNESKFWPKEDQPFSVARTEREEFDERKVHLNAIPQSAACDLVALPAYTVLPSSVKDAKERMRTDRPTACETTFEARVPGDAVPSFRSFAITRAYKIKVRLGVEIGGKSFEMDAESGVVNVRAVPVS